MLTRLLSCSWRRRLYFPANPWCHIPENYRPTLDRPCCKSLMVTFLFKTYEGRAIYQAVRPRLSNAAARLRSRIKRLAIRAVQSGSEEGFLRVLLIFFANFHCITCSVVITIIFTILRQAGKAADSAVTFWSFLPLFRQRKNLIVELYQK
jgi:hypothetical protein